MKVNTTCDGKVFIYLGNLVLFLIVLLTGSHPLVSGLYPDRKGPRKFDCNGYDRTVLLIGQLNTLRLAKVCRINPRD